MDDYGPIIKDWKYFSFWLFALFVFVMYGSVVVYLLSLVLRELRRLH